MAWDDAKMQQDLCNKLMNQDYSRSPARIQTCFIERLGQHFAKADSSWNVGISPAAILLPAALNLSPAELITPFFSDSGIPNDFFIEPTLKTLFFSVSTPNVLFIPASIAESFASGRDRKTLYLLVDCAAPINRQRHSKLQIMVLKKVVVDTKIYIWKSKKSCWKLKVLNAMFVCSKKSEQKI